MMLQDGKLCVQIRKRSANNGTRRSQCVVEKWWCNDATRLGDRNIVQLAELMMMQDGEIVSLISKLQYQ